MFFVVCPSIIPQRKKARRERKAAFYPGKINDSHGTWESVAELRTTASYVIRAALVMYLWNAHDV